MNLLTLRTRLRRAIGAPSEAQVSDTTIDEHLNDAYIEMCDEFKFRNMRTINTFTTLANIDKYQLASTVTTILRLWDETNQRPVGRWDMTDFARQGGQLQDFTGPPIKYIRDRDFIQLVPIPDAVYSLTYYAKSTPTALAADDDIPDIPEPWHKALIKLARHIYWDDVGDVAKAQYCYNNYRLWLQHKPDEYADELSSEIEDGGPVPAMIVGSRRGTDTRTWERTA